IGYWPALILAPLVVGLVGMAVERTMLSKLYNLDPLYGLLFTFGLALVIEGVFRYYFGVSGQPYAAPELLSGGTNLGFMFLPNYRGWVVVSSLLVCLGTWLAIEKTRLGAYLRAATENPKLVQAFGVNVPVLLTLTYGLGSALAGLAGILAAPVYQVSPLMGSNLIIVVFAVVVVGGMGSILGAIVTGYMLGLAEGLTRCSTRKPPTSSFSSSWRSCSCCGRPDCSGGMREMANVTFAESATTRASRVEAILLALGIAALVALPFFIYPI